MSGQYVSTIFEFSPERIDPMHIHGRGILYNKPGLTETLVARRVEQGAILLQSLQRYKRRYLYTSCYHRNDKTLSQAYLRKGKVPLRQLSRWLGKLQTDILHGNHLCRLINVTATREEVINLSITIQRTATLTPSTPLSGN